MAVTFHHFAKFILMLLNGMFMLAGAAFLVVGLLARYDQRLLLKALRLVPPEVIDDMTEGWDMGSFFTNGSLMIMAAGAILMVIGICGACGAHKENILLLSIYSVIVGLIIVMQVGFVSILMLNNDQVDEKVSSLLHKSIKKHYHEGAKGLNVSETMKLQFATTPVILAWDTAQLFLECCGVDGPADYSEFTGFYIIGPEDIENAQVPLSCCKILNKQTEKDHYLEHKDDDESEVMEAEQGAREGDGDDSTFSMSPTDIRDCLTRSGSMHRHQQGCLDRTRDLISEYGMSFVKVCAVGLTIELTSFAFAVLLINRKKKSRRESC